MALQLTISNLACTSGLDTFTKAVRSVDPNARVQAELGTKAKLVQIKTEAPEPAIRDALARVGYPAAEGGDPWRP